MLVAEDCLLWAVSPLSDVVWQTRYDDTCKGQDDRVQGGGTGGEAEQAGIVGTPAVMLVAEDCLLWAVSPLSNVVWQTRYDDTCKSDRVGP